MLKSIPELQAAIHIALTKVVDKADRDQLTDGASYSIDADVSGKIDGQAFNMPLKAVLTVGHASERATSQTPCVAQIITRLLGKMNGATRAAVIDELMTEYRLHGDIKAGDEGKAVADAFMSGLRQMKRSSVAGDVKLNSEAKEHVVEFKS